MIHLFLIVGVTRADLKHRESMLDTKDLTRSVREGRIEFRHSIKSMERMGSRSHDLGA